MITPVQQGGVWSPGTQPTSGNRTYYVYDGHDVALMLRRNGGSWSVLNRFLTGGLDQPLAGWFNTTSGTGPENLALIGDYQGSTRAAVRADGSPESQASYFSRNAFGSLENASGAGGSYNTATGFGGASTPNSTGGFTYLRNRWYDPATGRFLTQDPIGMAGGVNLYAYAGNNPVAFDDPFGLCPPCGLFVDPSSVFQAIQTGGYSRSDVLRMAQHNTSWGMLAGGAVELGAGLVRGGIELAAGAVSRALGRRVVIGAKEDLEAAGAVGQGERTLQSQMPGHLGSTEANWARNERVLLREMKAGKPIRDASVGVDGERVRFAPSRFIERERALLEGHGWTYDASTRLYSPPAPTP